jgi:hypothetical protein
MGGGAVRCSTSWLTAVMKHVELEFEAEFELEPGPGAGTSPPLLPVPLLGGGDGGEEH